MPSNGSYAGSPLLVCQTVLERTTRGGAVPRRPRAGVPFNEVRLAFTAYCALVSRSTELSLLLQHLAYSYATIT
jgi:hypothetical protein